MLHHAFVSLAIFLSAALIGLGGVASGAATLSQMLFFLFLASATFGLATGLVKGRN